MRISFSTSARKIYQRIMGNWKTMRGLYARLVVSCALVIVWTTVFLAGPQSEYGLEVWLDSQQSRVLGLNIPVYLISNGKPSAMLSRVKGGFLSPFRKFQLSRDEQFLNLTWRAPTGYKYVIEELSVSDHTLMRAPTLNLPSSGMVSSNVNVLRIGFPCSGDASGRGYGSVTMRLFQTPNFLNVDNDVSRPDHITLLFDIEKECRKRCHPPCRNEGKCDDWGVCQCPDGYYGPLCDQVLCNPKCHNGGICFSPDICVCPDGFSGAYCQKGLCTGNCNNHGTCIGNELCFCRKGWSGHDCSIKIEPR